MSSGGGWRSQSSLIKGGGQGTLAEPPGAWVLRGVETHGLAYAKH